MANQIPPGTKTHRDQHWIPKSYTKAWIDTAHPQAAVHRYYADGSYRDWRVPSKLFSEDELYTIKTREGDRSLVTEHTFQKIEDKYARIRKLIEKGEKPSIEDRQWIALFIAALRNRSPMARDHWMGFLDRVIDKGKSMQRAFERASPSEQKRMVARGALDHQRAPERSRSLEEVIEDRNRPFGAWMPVHVAIEAEILISMTMHILRTAEIPGFVTSDNPVVWWDTVEIDQDRPIGLSRKSMEVTLPMSPRLCVVLSHQSTGGMVAADRDLVDEINTRTLFYCRESFIADRADLTVAPRS